MQFGQLDVRVERIHEGLDRRAADVHHLQDHDDVIATDNLGANL